jgi:hypothetical protein
MHVGTEKLGLDLTGVDVTHVCMTKAVEHVQCILPATWIIFRRPVGCVA